VGDRTPEGKAAALETPIGWVPTVNDLDLDGLDADKSDIEAALRVDADEWRAELPLIDEWSRRSATRCRHCFGMSWPRYGSACPDRCTVGGPPVLAGPACFVVPLYTIEHGPHRVVHSFASCPQQAADPARLVFQKR